MSELMVWLEEKKEMDNITKALIVAIFFGLYVLIGYIEFNL